MAGYFLNGDRSPQFTAGQIYYISNAGAYFDRHQYYPVPSRKVYSFRSKPADISDQETTPGQLFQAAQDRFKRPYDTGHEFWSEKRSFTTSHKSVVLTRSSLPNARYVGPLWSGISGGLDDLVVPPIDLNYWGTLAIKNTKPDRPASSVSISILEALKEGLPSLIGMQTFKDNVRRSRPTKTAGGEWLNYQFGIIPLVNSIVDIAEAIKMADPIIRQYLRDSERIVRRRISFPSVYSSGEISSGLSNTELPPISSGTFKTELGVGPRTYMRDERWALTREIWFSGAYQYYIGKVNDDPYSKLDYFWTLADKLLGVKITPDVIYNIAPWSWMLDWFANFGDIVSNAVSFNQNGVLLRYGYTMCRSTYRRTITATDVPLVGGNWKPTVHTTYVVTRKERVRATPFGFGLNPNQFTGSQWAILAALGMTLGANKLR